MVEKAYLAGIIDGEGSVMVIRREFKGRVWHVLKLSISNTDERVIDWVKSKFREMNPNKPQRNTHKFIDKEKRIKDVHILVFCGENVKKILLEVIPFLIIKRLQARMAIDFPMWGRKGAGNPVPKEMIKERDVLFKIFKSLNKRGRAR